MSSASSRTGRAVALVTVLAMQVQMLPPVRADVSASTPTPLANAPLTTENNFPGNVLLTLSVEFPTGITHAYSDEGPFTSAAGTGCPGTLSSRSVCYFHARTYQGYFDPTKCYIYSPGADGGRGAFVPARIPNVGQPASCNGANSEWSGNFLNWSTGSALDNFRKTLTGGTRSRDTSSETILVKSNSDRDSYFPVKRISSSNLTVGGVTIPANTLASLAGTGAIPKPNKVSTGNLYVKVGGGGQRVQFAFGNNNFDDNSFEGDWQTANSTKVLNVRMAVKVCDPSVGLEANCKAYGSGVGRTYKPIGLIQEYSDRLRFGVVAYVNDSDSDKRDGGVLRSRMKSVGPQIPINGSSALNTVPIVNPNTEWDAATGVQVGNPDATDASASSVSRSGVINYLNEFGNNGLRADGTSSGAAYKTHDWFSEMYYEGLRYLRGKRAPVANYVANLTATMKDGFPVITAWDDPIINRCQKNFTISIGDSSTWRDNNLPGMGDATGKPAMPAEVSGDAGTVNAQTWINKILGLEPTVTRTMSSASQQGSLGVAGLAYWANTTDIRPDLGGKQTVRSYFVDVREPGSWDGKNQYWLGGKYGGFDDVNENGVPANKFVWDANDDGDPDNYFRGSRPDLIDKGLRQAFIDIIRQIQSGSRATFTSATISTDTAVFQSRFNSNDWSGNIVVSKSNVAADGTLTFLPVPNWLALDTQAAGNGWDNGRRIFTGIPSATSATAVSGVPFRLNQLSTYQQETLGSTATERSDALRWLRGDLTVANASLNVNAALYRPRTTLLGDIVNASGVLATQRSVGLGDRYNPGYKAYVTSKASRKQILYVAANDGMLHAFDASSITSGGGRELWAYVPSALFDGPSQPSTPSSDGLRALALAGYEHRYYVDATPTLWDVDFARTGGPTSSVDSTSSDWRTILVGGLGKGGRMVYALDVTRADSISSEAEAAGQLLWEFTDPDLGFVYGRPIVAKTANHGWVVMVASGYNNLLNPTGTNERVGGRAVGAEGSGGGFLFVLNAQTGAVLEKVALPVGSRTDPAGFAHVRGFIPVQEDGTVTEVYGGDLKGNVWRIDTTNSSTAFASPTAAFAQLAVSGVPQPVTSRPYIVTEPLTSKRWVFVGTGRLLHSSDKSSAQTQTLYAIRDGRAARRWDTTPETGISESLPASGSLPVGRAQMQAVSSLLAGTRMSDSTPMGWYFDLPENGERVLNEITGERDFVSWTGTMPGVSGCENVFETNTYAVSVRPTGLVAKTMIADASGNAIQSHRSSTTGSQIVAVQGKMMVLTSGANANSVGASVGQISGLPRGSVVSPGLNWRTLSQR
ncbi:MAG: pilus assembly protein [Burkholderiaceae bacterium]